MGEVWLSGAGDYGFESHLGRLIDVYGGRGEFAGLNPRAKGPGLGGGGRRAGTTTSRAPWAPDASCSPLPVVCINTPHTKSFTTFFVQLPCEPIPFYRLLMGPCFKVLFKVLFYDPSYFNSIFISIVIIKRIINKTL